MAYYCEVTDLTRTSPYVIMSHFDLIDDTDGSILLSGTLGFRIFERDDLGNIIPESLAQKRARFKTTFDAYADELTESTAQIDQYFDNIRSQAIGYRYPAA